VAADHPHLFQSPDLGELVVDAATLQARVAELGAEITRDYADRSPLLIGVLKGAAMFMTDLARAIALPLEIDFMAVSSYGAPPFLCRASTRAPTLARDVRVRSQWMELAMSDSQGGNSNRGNNNTLFFIVGGLVVIAGVFVYLFTNGDLGGAPDDVNVTVEQPAAPAEPAPAEPAPATNGTTNQ
jgi:hypothetical protein